MSSKLIFSPLRSISITRSLHLPHSLYFVSYVSMYFVFVVVDSVYSASYAQHFRYVVVLLVR